MVLVIDMKTWFIFSYRNILTHHPSWGSLTVALKGVPTLTWGYIGQLNHPSHACHPDLPDRWWCGMEGVTPTGLIREPWHQDTHSTWDQQQLRVFEASGIVHADEGYMFQTLKNSSKHLRVPHLQPILKTFNTSQIPNSFKTVHKVSKTCHFHTYSKMLKTFPTIFKFINLQTVTTISNHFQVHTYWNPFKPCQET